MLWFCHAALIRGGGAVWDPTVALTRDAQSRWGSDRHCSSAPHLHCSCLLCPGCPVSASQAAPGSHKGPDVPLAHLLAMGVVCRWGLKCVPTTGWHPSAQSSQETLLSNPPVPLFGSRFAACSCENALFWFSSQKIRTDHSQESFASSWCSPRAAPPLTQKSLIQYSPLRTADFWPLSACSDRGVLCCLPGASSAAGSCFHSMQWPALSWTVTLLCYFYIFSGLPCAITWINFSFFFFLISIFPAEY